MNIKKLSILAIFATVLLSGCSSEIPEGSMDTFNALPSQEEKDEMMIKKDFLPLNHPCMLHSAADLNRIKTNIAVSPWSDAYAHLQTSSYAQSTYTERTAALLDGYLKRMDAGNWSSKYADYSNYTAAMYDAHAAYQLALRYHISGNTQYADAAVKVLNAWKNNCKGILRLEGYTYNVPDPNLYLANIQAYQFANAAELLRNYDGWASTDFVQFQQWMKDCWYSLADTFLRYHGGGQGSMHYWLNWDLANLTAVLSIGILCDDNKLINWAISYFKNEDGLFHECGNIKEAVPFIHQDPDSPELLGQCEESGRDQGHATLCVALLGTFCQMALNVGEDLFAYDDYRALKMAEYVAKHNLLKDASYNNSTNTSSVNLTEADFAYDHKLIPYTSYTNPAYTCEVISTLKGDNSRGTKRPCWELFYNYAKSHGQSAIYCEKWVNQMRANNPYKSDGGGGDYGPNSGGFDQLGYGTLMFAR